MCHRNTRQEKLGGTNIRCDYETAHVQEDAAPLVHSSSGIRTVVIMETRRWPWPWEITNEITMPLQPLSPTPDVQTQGPRRAKTMWSSRVTRAEGMGKETEVDMRLKSSNDQHWVLETEWHQLTTSKKSGWDTTGGETTWHDESLLMPHEMKHLTTAATCLMLCKVIKRGQLCILRDQQSEYYFVIWVKDAYILNKSYNNSWSWMKYRLLCVFWR